jgi:hypothetical protein
MIHTQLVPINVKFDVGILSECKLEQKTSVFFTVNHIHPSLMFSSKAGVYTMYVKLLMSKGFDINGRQ